jgi:hypothetical protein
VYGTADRGTGSTALYYGETQHVTSDTAAEATAVATFWRSARSEFRGILEIVDTSTAVLATPRAETVG